MVLSDIKKGLRKDFLLKRQGFSREQSALKHRLDQRIGERLLDFLSTRSYATIMLYYPHHGEVSLLGMLNALMGKKTILFPRVGDGGIEPVGIESTDDFAPGYRGISEPRGEVFAGAIDVVLVPGIAFTVGATGGLGRIGYGGGFYDRFLDRHNTALKIGVFYEFQKTSEDFHEPHDQFLDMIVSERMVYRNALLV